MYPQTQTPTLAEGPLTALRDLMQAVRQLDSLTAQVGPFSLYPDAGDQAPELVAAVCEAVDVPLTFDRPADGRKDFAVVALGAEIQRAQSAPELGGLHPAEATAAARIWHEEENAGIRWHAVRRPDGSVVRAVEAGPPQAPCVVLSTPSGMGYRLTQPWLTALRDTHRCVIVEARGTSGLIEDPEDFDRCGYDFGPQVEDLLAVIEELGTDPVHIMGLCAGAAVALEATARRPDRVGSLSLWHADLELGTAAEKTNQQINLRNILDLAGESRDTAAWLRGKLTGGPMTGVPYGVGPLVVRPYAATELFYRYAKLTAATMHQDSRQTVRRVSQRCLVVTNVGDPIAHPAGSRWVADTVPGARQVVVEYRDHLDAFGAPPEYVACLRSFLVP
jgi:3-oxoadipate enol-lactonase